MTVRPEDLARTLIQRRRRQREAYARKAEVLRANADRLLGPVPRLDASLGRFDAFLQQALDALGKS